MTVSEMRLSGVWHAETTAGGATSNDSSDYTTMCAKTRDSRNGVILNILYSCKSIAMKI